MPTYGGDEVSGLVVSPSSDGIVSGYAGEDTPKSFLSSEYGYTLDSHDIPKRFVGDSGVNVWRDNMHIASPIRDGIVDDIEAFSEIVHASLVGGLRVNPAEHPLLITEPAWNSREHREKLAEIAFEQFNVPGFYVANESVLSSFAAGKSSSLVVNISSDQMSAVPVYEGFVLRKGVIRQPLGTNSLSAALLSLYPHQSIQNNFIPHHLISSKTPVESGQPAIFTLNADRKSKTTPTWEAYHSSTILNDWRDTVVQVLDAGWDELKAQSRPTKLYEFQNGFNAQFGLERFKAAEVLFSPAKFYDHKNPVPAPPTLAQASIPALAADKCIGLAEMIVKSIFTTDADIRTALLGNIVLVGSGSSIPGLTDRLTWELNQLAPNNKIRIHAPGNTIERKFAPWLGGSIVASLGTFHQLWISAEEYKELGKEVVGTRCK